MRITNSANTISYNNKSQLGSPKRQMPVTQPVFTGFLDLFRKPATKDVFVNSTMKILSPRQIKKAKQNVVTEVVSLFKTPFSPGVSKRMDELLNSPYVDYSMPFDSLGNTLIDYIDRGFKNTKNRPLYNQFLRTSLAKTMPFELLDKEQKLNLYCDNNGIFDIFQSYTKIDENSKEAKEVRDMVLRMKKNGVEIDEYPQFFVDCLYNGKLEMCKLLEEHFDVINPETRIKVIATKKSLEDYQKVYGSSIKLFRNPQQDHLYNEVLLYYPKKFDRESMAYFSLDWNTATESLWNIVSWCKDKNAKEILDIPKYIFKIKNKYRERGFGSSQFYANYLKVHPEMKTLDFIEKLAKYFLYNADTKTVNDYSAINFIQTRDFSINDNKALADECFTKIGKLSDNLSEESEERIKVLKELYRMFAKNSGASDNEITAKLKALDMPGIGQLDGEVFKVYENVSSISSLNLYQKRELLQKLLDNKSNLIDCKLGDMLDVKFLPKNNDEFCELVARLSHSIGLNVKKLSPELKNEFIGALNDMSKPDSEFMHLDFDNSIKRLRLNYSLDEFKKDIWYSVNELSNVQRGKVLDFFGFELKNENGKLTLNGFPNVDSFDEKIQKVKNESFFNKIKEIQAYVIEFTRKNEVNIKGFPQASQNITSIIRAFPEFLTSFGKLQSNGHDFSLDIHTLKVLQEIFKNPEYQKLSPKSRLHLQMAVLFHDLTKAEGVVDKLHPQSSSFDTYYLLKKLDISEKEKLKIYQIIRNHTWFSAYKGETSYFNKQLAFELSHDDAFKLLTILTEADMKAVKKDGKFFTQYGKDLQKAKDEISKLVYDVQKTAINLPQTKIPKATELNTNSPYVSEINADGIKNTVIRLNPAINLKEAGFSSNIALNDLNILVHGLDDKNSASMFQALANVNSDALLSTSYINYGKGNWKVFRNQGFVLDVSSSNIHAGYWCDFGSGYKKNKNNIINSYLFSDVQTRSYFSDQLKKELNLSDREYIELYSKIEDLPIEKLDQSYPEVANAYRHIFASMETARSSMGRNYNEILVTNPKIQAIFCWNKGAENIPAYLRKFAQRHNLPILMFE